MTKLARLGVVALGLTYLHLVFGGVVRITGSGMGCGDHWPKCNGSWIPPFHDATVMIEWTHRLLALLVILSIAWFALRSRRDRQDGAGRAVAAPAFAALVLVVIVALVGMVTVKLGNTTLATLAHWTLATSLLGVLIAATVRAGGLGGDAALRDGGSARTARSIAAGAALAFAAVVLGGLVAKSPGAGVACPGFPLCGDSPADLPAGAAHIQVTHRVVAYLLVFHVLAISSAIRRRAGESAAVKRTLRIALVLVVLQIALGAAMVLSNLPPSLRVMHQLVGTGIWVTLFLAAYLARVATRAPVALGDRNAAMGGAEAPTRAEAR